MVHQQAKIELRGNNMLMIASQQDLNVCTKLQLIAIYNVSIMTNTINFIIIRKYSRILRNKLRHNIRVEIARNTIIYWIILYSIKQNIKEYGGSE